MALSLFQKYGVEARRFIPGQVTIALNGNGDLQADVSGTPFTAADYIVYDWRVDGTSIALLNTPFATNVATDYSTYNRTPTVGANTTHQTNGIETNAGSFDFPSGGTGEIDYGDITQLDGTNAEITIIGWVNIDVINAFDVVGGIDNGFNWHLSRNASSNNLGFFVGPGVSTLSRVTTDGSWTTGAYLMGAVVFDGSLPAADRVKIYVDGSERTTSGNNFGTTLAEPLAGSTWEWGSINRGSFSIDGQMDSALLYDRALSPQQISLIYNSGIPLYSIIVEEEFSGGSETWTCVATPIIGGVAGTPVTSNSFDPTA